MLDFESVRKDLEHVVGQSALPEGKTLTDFLQRLDEASKTEGIPAQMKHYLERRSYLKALAWLDNPEMKHTL